MNLEEIGKIAIENKKLISENKKLINDNFERIQNNTYALELIKDYKKDRNRWFIILIIVLFMWFATIGYLVYVLNDIGSYDEITTQEIEDIDTINGNVINRGDIDGLD